MTDSVLGPIARLQIQTEPVKRRGEGYDPSPILSVDELTVGPLGATATTPAGVLLDVHHPSHPRARGGGNRALSIGFTGHYRRMAERFGSAPLGVAGENIVVECDREIRLGDLGTLLVRSAHGEVTLTTAGVAAPCAEFTCFLMGSDEIVPKSDLPDEIEFLENGTRGFILDMAGLAGPVSLRIGDEVRVRS